MAVTPFHFKLKKVSGRQQRLLNAIYAYLPATGLRDEFGRGLAEAVARHVGEGFSLRLEALAQEPYAAYLEKLPQTGILVVVGLAPLSRRAILEIDPSLAMMLIERLLGGQAEAMPEPRPLSDTEQGVLEYLLLQAMAHVHRLCGKDTRVHFRFERFAQRPHEVAGLAEGGDGVAVLVFRVEVGRHSGFVRLALPDPFVEEGMLDAPAPGELRPAERAWRQRQIDRFGHLKVPLWAEAGRATLSPTDLGDLEEGDVILFDRAEVSAAEGELSGRVVLRVGTGLHGGLLAGMTTEGTKAHCTIQGMVKGD